MADASDEYDFTPSSSSNLRSLFDATLENAENSSLIYTAPKQPRPVTTSEINTETTKVETSVICAHVVQVWKLINGKYVAAGKHGFAIIGSSNQTSCEAILYKEKRNVIMRVKVNPDFEFSLKRDNFASFYDSLRNNWLIKFSTQNESRTLIDSIEKYGGKIVSEGDNKPVDESALTNFKESITVGQDSSESKVRADILTRIAKMGQSILPNKSMETDEGASENVHINTERNSPVNSTTMPSSINTIETVRSFQNREENSLATTAPNFVEPTRSFQNIPNTVIMTQPVTYDPLSIYVAENRTQNSELRMNLSQISDKLNSILKLVETGQPSNEQDTDILKSKIKVLELRNENLTKELTSVRVENTKLKQEVECSHNNSKREDQFRLELEMKGEEHAVKIAEYETELNVYKNNIEELSTILEKQKTEIEALKKSLMSYQDEKLGDEIPKLQNTIAELQEKLTQCEEQKHQAHIENTPNGKENEKREDVIGMLKEEMNGMYANIVSNFNESQQSASDINAVIAQNIKHTTLKIIQNFQQIYDIQHD